MTLQHLRKPQYPVIVSPFAKQATLQFLEFLLLSYQETAAIFGLAMEQFTQDASVGQKFVDYACKNIYDMYGLLQSTEPAIGEDLVEAVLQGQKLRPTLCPHGRCLTSIDDGNDNGSDTNLAIHDSNTSTLKDLAALASPDDDDDFDDGMDFYGTETASNVTAMPMNSTNPTHDLSEIDS